MNQWISWAHPLARLGYLAQGDSGKAATELAASIQVPTGTFMPSMALAKALLETQPKAVIAFLDAASRREDWKNRNLALGWKADVESGHTPNFGALANFGIF
ncbi:MAG: hypothetical protein ACR2I2_20770 [Bryobacteraceae bacterium]